MKKVAIFMPNLLPGGAEIVLVNLLNYWDSRYYEVSLVLACKIGIIDRLNPSVRVKYSFRRNVRGLTVLSKFLPPRLLYRIFIRDSYDISIAYMEGFAARVIGGAPPSVKRVVWLHIEMLTAFQIRKGFLSVRSARKCYQRFDCTCAVSEGVLAAAKANALVSEKNSCVIYNAVDKSRISQKSKERLSVHDRASKDMFTFCSVAKIGHTKGYDRLMRVHRDLINAGFNHEIIIIGEGNDRYNLEKMVIEFGLQNSMRFIGFRSNPYPIIAQCDAYICSSRREGFSTAITEAIILGLPVITTLTAGSFELCGKNGEYGLIVENSEKGIKTGMERILSDNEYFRELKNKSLARADLFTGPKESGERIEEMMDNLNS